MLPRLCRSLSRPLRSLRAPALGAALLAACAGGRVVYRNADEWSPEVASVEMSGGASAVARVTRAKFSVHPTGGARAVLEFKSHALFPRTLRCTYTWLDGDGVPIGARDDLGTLVQLGAGETRLATEFASLGPRVAGYRVYIDVP